MLPFALVLFALGCALAIFGWLAVTTKPIVHQRDEQALFVGVALALAGAAALVLSFVVQPAAAQPLICATTADMERMITGRGQFEIGAGIVGEQLVLRLFSAPDGETFTVITSDAQGRSCLLAMGIGLDIVPPPADVEGEG